MPMEYLLCPREAEQKSLAGAQILRMAVISSSEQNTSCKLSV